VIEQRLARGGTLTDRDTHDLLVSLGHASHAVEDFFFHSNFVELAEHMVRPDGSVSRFDPDETKDKGDPEGDRVPAPDSVRWDRFFFRRLRQPVFGADGETEFDDATSVVPQIVFTASIPLPDIFHTFFDAIGHLAEPQPFDVMPIVEQIVASCESAAPTGQLITLLLGLDGETLRRLPAALMGKFVPGEDETHEDRENRDKAYRAYKCLIERDLLALVFNHLANSGVVPRSAADAIAEASKIERELWSYLPGFASSGSGAAKFMITLLEQGRDAVTAATKRTEELDELNKAEIAAGKPAEQRSGYVASNNGSSAERIGTHSLMSKDSVRKQPLRRQAINGAGFTVSYLASKLFEQRTGASAVADGVEWVEALHHFLIHPEQAAAGPGTEWWRTALQWDRAEANRPVAQHTLKSASPAAIRERATEQKRRDLEFLYNDLAEEGERRFRAAVDTDWVIGSMLWGGLAGGVLGLVGAGVDDAGQAVFGTTSGVATGMVLAGIMSGVSTEINDHAGSVVGLLAGLATASIAGYGVGRIVRST
jgi:hypothetical protein